jgi:hypothetical protein
MVRPCVYRPLEVERKDWVCAFCGSMTRLDRCTTCGAYRDEYGAVKAVVVTRELSKYLSVYES